MRAAARRQWPSPKQLKYIGRFLTTKEKRALALCLAALILGLALGMYGYMRTHRTEVPAVGGDFKEIVVGSPFLPNPLYATTNDADADIVRLVYSGLLKVNETGDLVPDLAESWSASPDGRTHTFTLRNDVTWHDGETFDSDDVLFTFEAIKDPAVKSPWKLSFQNVTIKKTSDRTVTFTLGEPFAAFAHAFTVGILPEHVWAQVQPVNFRLAPGNLKPVGTGPYRMTAFFKDSVGAIHEVRLERFDQFYGGGPYLETVVLKYVPDRISAEDLFANRVIDGFQYITPDNRDRLVKRDVRAFSVILPQYNALFMNAKHNDILKEKEVRRALALTVDKDRLVRDTLRGAGTRLAGPIPPGMIGFAPELAVAFDPAGAQKLFDNVGWTMVTKEKFIELRRAELQKLYQGTTTTTASGVGTGATTGTPDTSLNELNKIIDEHLAAEIRSEQTVFRAKKITPLALSLTTVNTPELTRAAEVVRDMWEAVGVNTLLRIIEPGRMQKDVIRSRNFDVLLYGEVLGNDPDPYAFWHSSQIDDPGLNLTSFVNRTADQILEKARMATSTTERQKFYTDFQKILLDEVPAIFLYAPEYTYVIRDRIKGAEVKHIAMPSDRFSGINTWYEKTRGEWK